MARHERLILPTETWTELSQDDIESITFQNTGKHPVHIAVTAGAAPNGVDGALIYEPGQGERNVALGDLAPGVGTPLRVYAFASHLGHNEVFVSHA